jgi:DNA repair exonuclease SbcCD nuclease subunit
MRAPDGISSDLIERCSKIFDWVVCGDFHKFQFVNELSNVYYCGSSKQLNLSDAGDKRGYQILDLTDKKLHFVRSKSSRFKILEVVVGEYTHPWIENPDGHSKSIADKICVVSVSGSEDQVAEFDFESIKSSLIERGARGVYRKTGEIFRERRNSVRISKDLPVREIIHKYVEHRDYDSEESVRKRHVVVLSRYARESHE